MLRPDELKGVTVAASNSAVLQLLAEHYSLELPAELQQQAGTAPAAALLGNSLQLQQASGAADCTAAMSYNDAAVAGI
jgi:hypothetical protein